MKEEKYFMEHNGVWDLVEYQRVARELVVSGSSRLNVTLMETLNVTRLDLLLRNLLRKMALIIKRRFHRSHEKILSGLSWHLVAHSDLELHQMDVKIVFLNGDLKDNIYMDQPIGFSVEENEHMVCKLKKSIYSLKASFPPMVFEV